MLKTPVLLQHTVDTQCIRPVESKTSRFVWLQSSRVTYNTLPTFPGAGVNRHAHNHHFRSEFSIFLKTLILSLTGCVHPSKLFNVSTGIYPSLNQTVTHLLVYCKSISHTKSLKIINMMLNEHPKQESYDLLQ